MLFYFVRHGDPIYDPDSLTELGHKQAAALAKRLSILGFDEIYCSTSVRAQQTAAPTCEALGITPKLLEWTNERYAWEEFAIVGKANEKKHWVFQLGEYMDMFNEKSVRDLGFKWYEHEYFKDYPSFGEGIKRIDKETDDFFLSLGYKHNREIGGYEPVAPNEKRIALFAHQGFGLSFFSSFMDIPYPYFSTHFDFGHSSVTVVHFRETGLLRRGGEKYIYPKILQLSNDSHLYKEDILTGYQNRWDI